MSVTLIPHNYWNLLLSLCVQDARHGCDTRNYQYPSVQLFFVRFGSLLFSGDYLFLLLLLHQGPRHMPRMHRSLQAYCATLNTPPRETLAAKGGFCLNVDFHPTFRDLLYAANLQHGTEGFTSPAKEGALRIFFALKNPKAGFEPANLGTKGQHATPRPPKPLGDSLKKIRFLLPANTFQFYILLWAPLIVSGYGLIVDKEQRNTAFHTAE